MSNIAKKFVLPTLNITRISEIDDEKATCITLKLMNRKTTVRYFSKPVVVAHPRQYRETGNSSQHLIYELFPLILDSQGAPWPEANLWLLSTLQNNDYPDMATYNSMANDMVSYLKFLEESYIDWTDFPQNKLKRPTYRYNAYLKFLVQNEEMSFSTAKRKMGRVYRFYKWLRDEKIFQPSYPAWNESDVYVATHNFHGDVVSKKVTTTDISIKIPHQEDPYSEYIQDGGKLRPLSHLEQTWLLEALVDLGNTEMLLIHLFGLLTGARIQTILTFRIENVWKEINTDFQGFVRIPVGYGTGIDTKFGKRQVLHVPRWFYEKLRIYAHSQRAQNRRLNAAGGDVPKQFLFLTQQGNPFYQAKSQLPVEKVNTLRHSKNGQALRQYISEFVIPYIRKKRDSNFQYRPHDLRASFGMNLVDDKMKLVDQKLMTISQVLDFVQIRMGHSAFKVTERYLNYRSKLKIVRKVQDGWEESLTELAKNAVRNYD